MPRLQATARAPEFAVSTADGVLHAYAPDPASHEPSYSIADDLLEATVAAVGAEQWELRIVRADREIQKVYFPWQSQRAPLDSDISDDIFYYPMFLGYSHKAAACDRDFEWHGSDPQTYPGGTFSPLVVMADADDARIVAATNWPPRAVIPMYSAQRMVLLYKEALQPGATAAYRALVARLDGRASTGEVPWQLAIDRYKDWLDSKLPPPTYPEWMWRGEGYLAIGLQNQRDYSIDSIKKQWGPIRDVYPWIVFWGQMSAYAGDCCALEQGFHARYDPTLAQFARNEVDAAGYHAAYYSAPHSGTSAGDPKRLLDTPAGEAWLRGWLDRNRDRGANSFYIDTLGRAYWGSPEAVLNLFRSGVLPRDSLIEGVVDIYPVPGLASGVLTGYDWTCGAPQKTPENSTITTFPRFGRYLLRDRMIYLGPSNSDFIFWGDSRNWMKNDSLSRACGYVAHCRANGPCEQWAEREAFLLGARLDASRLHESTLLERIIRLRQGVGWWARRPVYYDTKGLDLSSVPVGARVEIRRFVDKEGADLFAIYNVTRAKGVTFGYEGRSIAVPADTLSIVDLKGLRRVPR